ncbi:MAG: DNA integrity scanning diadenylate cyclase DisA [Coriobacteriia bacterium]|nr:DNA integrity scanning diadenylate cyclase DisA [Coriobacteriia bacterium]
MREDVMLAALKSVAPGTPLRQALDNVIAGRTGALIVIGDEKGVDSLSNGGFVIDAPFTPQRLFELAKMDGAILLDAGATRLRRANVHLMPNPALPTSETGMRHRTAERVSRQTDALVISVSQRREVVSLYRDGDRLWLEDIDVVLSKASQALQTLERYRTRLTEVSAHLTALEFEDMVTFGDVALVIHRFEMLRRVGRELNRYVIELGAEGRLVRMQAEELTVGAEEDFLMLVRDYIPDQGPRKAAAALTRLAALTPEQLLDPAALAGALGFAAKGDVDELHVRPKGYRLLHRVPLLPGTVTNRLVDRFGTVKALLEATEQQLDDVDGVGARRAQAIREGLRRMRERAVL